jgi:hypothetical protein
MTLLFLRITEMHGLTCGWLFYYVTIWIHWKGMRTFQFAKVLYMNAHYMRDYFDEEMNTKL